MNRKYTTSPAVPRAKARQLLVVILYVSTLMLSRSILRDLLLLFLPKEPPMSTFRLVLFFFFFPSFLSSSSFFVSSVLSRVFSRSSTARCTSSSNRDNSKPPSSSSRRVVVHAAREAEQARRDENVPGASRPRVERHFSLRRGGCSSSNKSRVLKCEIVETSKTTTTTTKNATQKSSRVIIVLHTSELEKGRFSFDFGKRNDRAERIAGNGRDVSFESTTFRAKIALNLVRNRRKPPRMTKRRDSAVAPKRDWFSSRGDVHFRYPPIA